MSTTTLAPDWRDRAACRDADDPEIWFSTAYYTQIAAKEICQQCSVLEACLAEYRREEEGIFGGLTPDERGVRRSKC